MKNKKIITMISAIAMNFSCVNMPVYAVNSTSTEAITEITVENNPELWERFLKYDLRITDYNSLSEEEKALCKFIFETERNAEDTIICERARLILAGYNVGERIPEKLGIEYNANDYEKILDELGNYYGISYIVADNMYLYDEEYFSEYYNSIQQYAFLQVTPDIRHIDENNQSNEYWLDESGNDKIQSYKSYDMEISWVASINNSNYEIPQNTESLPTMKYNDCTYQIYPDNTLALFEVNSNDDIIDIPESINDMTVTEIKPYAFKNSNVISVHLPETINYIDTFAFNNCQNLKDINFPENLNFISASAFENCNSLEDIVIDCPDLIISGYAFYKSSAKNITINIKAIPNGFVNCFRNYETFTIGNDVKEIGDIILNENIQIPENVKIITWFPVFSDSITIPKQIEILGAYEEAKGRIVTSGIEPPEPNIPLLRNTNIMIKTPNGIINGYYGTEAHNYALSHNLKFNPLDDLTYGDANNDGNINIADAVSLQNYLFGNDSVGYEADTNRDGKIDIFDMIILRKQIIENNKSNFS